MSGEIIVKVVLTGHEALIARLKNAPDKLLSSLKSDLLDLALDMRDQAAAKTNPKSGKLADSITGTIVQGGSSVGINLGSSGVVYAGIQEDGGNIPGRTINAVNAKALAFLFGAGSGMKSGDTSFFNSVDWPGATIPAKHYILNTLKMNRQEFMSVVQRAVDKAVAP